MGNRLGLIVLAGVSVVVLLSALAWWVGPALINLAVLDDRRDLPYTHLDFVRIDNAEVYQARYRMPLAGLVASEEGVVAQDYQLVHLMYGKSRDAWSRFALVQMNQAKDWVQVVTAGPYRLMLEALNKGVAEDAHQSRTVDTLHLGSFDVPNRVWRESLVLFMLQASDETQTDPLAPMLNEISTGDGRLVWDTPVLVTGSGAEWQRVVVVDFANPDSALAWLRQPQMLTAHALSNARSTSLAIAVFQRR